MQLDGEIMRFSIILVLVTTMLATACGSDRPLAPGDTISPEPANGVSPSPATPTPTVGVATATPWPTELGPSPTPFPTNTPIIIPPHNYESCELVDEFTVAASGGPLDLVLISGTAYDNVPATQRPTAYPAPELVSRQSDARFTINFWAGYPTRTTGIEIERLGPGDRPQCLSETFGDGPVWRIDPIDRSIWSPMSFGIEILGDGPFPGETRDAYRVLLLTESAEVMDITSEYCCDPGVNLIFGNATRLGFVMLAERD